MRSGPEIYMNGQNRDQTLIREWTEQRPNFNTWMDRTETKL